MKKSKGTATPLCPSASRRQLPHGNRSMGWALGQKRTLLGAGRRSAKCQERHYIPQQPAPLFDHLVGDVSVGALAAPTPCAQVCGPGPARFTSCSLGGRPALHQMSLTAWERNVMK